MLATKSKLAEIAKIKALLPYHGYLDGNGTNIGPLIKPFPKWNIKDADNKWCAAFVLHCCLEAGFEIPYSPNECVTCSLAGCGGWEEFAIGVKEIAYYKRDELANPKAGDIVLYDRVFENKEHDHIGIVLEKIDDYLIVAEGNVSKVSAIVKRRIDDHIRAYIRIPDGYRYNS